MASSSIATPPRPTARYPTTFRLRHARTTTGCLTCRSRKKKCDEGRPCCAGCLRGGLNCIWPRHVGSDFSIKAPSPRHRDPISDSQDAVPTSPISCQLSMAKANTAYGLTAESSLLLQHYLSETAVLLSAGTPSQNPFIVYVLPLAQRDSLLMHSVLAVGGAHLAYKLPDAVNVENATSRHYLHAIRGVRETISSGQVDDKNSIQRLTLILSFLCQYEVLNNAPTRVLSLHLRAIRQLFLRLIEKGYNPSIPLDDLDEFLSFVYEGYSFLVCANSIAPSTTSGENDISCQEPLRALRQSSCFGSIFGGAQGLFELIPQVQNLYLRRLAEEAMDITSPSLGFQAGYDRLSCLIESWTIESTLETPSASLEETHSDLDFNQRSMAAEVIRNSLRIYLFTSLCGSGTPTPETQTSIEDIAKTVIDMAAVLEDSPYASHTVWALVIAGSCLLDDKYRSRLAESLTQSRYKMRHLSAVRKVLELLWADDGDAYGPYGLHLVMQKHGVSLSIM
ncbi:hypothetical protein ACJZ2D_012009 [Fusarium nematophilum]